MTNNIHDDMEKSKILVIGEGFLGSHLISELKKQAVVKLIDNVDHSQVLDYL